MFTGSVAALVAPIGESGNICRTSLKKLIDYHVASGTSAIASVGTTDESMTLSHEEYGNAVIMTLELADGRIPVIAGTGANTTAEAVGLTKRFNGNGVVDCLTVTPYYNRPTQGNLFQHFKAIVEHTGLPQILYNVPSHIGCGMLPKAVGRLTEIEDIVGIRKTTGGLSRVHQIKELVSDGFILLSGDDATGMDFIQLGGVGAISTTAGMTVREMADTYRLALAGQFAGARAISQRLIPLHTKLFVKPNPTPMKWGCKALGPVATDTLCLPMTPITDHGREAAAAALKHTGLL